MGALSDTCSEPWPAASVMVADPCASVSALVENAWPVTVTLTPGTPRRTGRGEQMDGAGALGVGCIYSTARSLRGDGVLVDEAAEPVVSADPGG